MGSGLDTTFLVCIEVKEHPQHFSANTLLTSVLGEKRLIGLAPQVLSEFIHVVTDPKRFANPLTPAAAVERAGFWWNAREITQVFPTRLSTEIFLEWMKQHGLGRKRLLDTQMAATYFAAGLTTILTTNPRDFQIFDGVSVRVP